MRFIAVIADEDEDPCAPTARSVAQLPRAHFILHETSIVAPSSRSMTLPPAWRSARPFRKLRKRFVERGDAEVPEPLVEEQCVEFAIGARRDFDESQGQCETGQERCAARDRVGRANAVCMAVISLVKTKGYRCSSFRAFTPEQCQSEPSRGARTTRAKRLDNGTFLGMIRTCQLIIADRTVPARAAPRATMASLMGFAPPFAQISKRDDQPKRAVPVRQRQRVQALFRPAWGNFGDARR